MNARDILLRIAIKDGLLSYGTRLFSDEPARAGQFLREIRQQIHHQAMKEYLGEHLIKEIENYFSETKNNNIEFTDKKDRELKTKSA